MSGVSLRYPMLCRGTTGTVSVVKSPLPIRPARADLLVAAVSLLGSCYVFFRLLADPYGAYLADSSSDQTLFEWFFSATAHAIVNGHNPLAISAQNAPEGINGMGNTTVLSLAIPLAPVTLIWGPQITFVLIMVCGMAATSYAWYWLFSRHMVSSRTAAALAGAFCAFSPAMVSHANGHLNMVVHFTIPFVLGVFLRLGTSRTPGRHGFLLGVLAAVQIMIGEEIFLIAALGFAVFVLVACWQQRELIRERWRSTFLGTLTGIGVAGALTAYPLWYQFAGPMHYDGLPAAQLIFNDLVSFAVFPTRSLAGDATVAASYTGNNPTEENSFFGWPLLFLALIIVIWRRRETTIRTACVTGILFALLSCRDPIYVNGYDIGISEVFHYWDYLEDYPLFSDVIVGRFAFVSIPMLAIVLAHGIERLQSIIAAECRPHQARLTSVGLTATYLALLPVFPTPLATADRSDVPRFFTAGTWRQYVPNNGVVVAVPLPYSKRSWALDWQMAADMEFRIAAGYFVGPSTIGGCQPGCYGRYGAPARPTGELLLAVAKTGQLPSIDAEDRVTAWSDLSYWDADAVVLDPATAPNPYALKATVDSLLGAGTLVDGIWIWQVSEVTAE